MVSKLTQIEIDQILNQKNLVLRNLQITLGYYRIAQDLSTMVGDKDVNWFCFGCYASKTAGQALRHELLPEPLKLALIRAAGYDNTADYLVSVLRNDSKKEEVTEEDNLLASVLSEVSLLVSEGNYLIFSELAWPFTAFVDTFSADQHPDQGKIQAFLDEHFDPRPIEDGGQAYLREAFSAFYTAHFQKDAKKKAEWVLLGNLMTGYHEQTRVQPIIEEALAAPFDVFTEELISDDDELDTLIEESGKRMIGFSRQLVLKAITWMWMTYYLPEGEIKLGHDVVVPHGMNKFPKELLSLENSRTIEIVRKFDKDLNTVKGSAAENWGSLDDRMMFLTDFFRSYQRYKPLFQAPFSQAQISSILSNQVPDGPL
jgi:hypothetical protein